MGLESRIQRLERRRPSGCALCGGEGKLVIVAVDDEAPRAGCDRCGLLRRVRFPLAIDPPPPHADWPGWYVHQARRPDVRPSRAVRASIPPSRRA